MKCRKCGAEIPDNSIRCSHCGIKVNIVCPQCKTLNLFGSKVCSECGFELLKACPQCNTLNIYSADVCRKCASPFEAVNPDKDDIKQPSETFEIVNSFSSGQNLAQKPKKDELNDLLSIHHSKDEPDKTELKNIFNIDEENTEDNETPELIEETEAEEASLQQDEIPNTEVNEIKADITDEFDVPFDVSSEFEENECKSGSDESQTENITNSETTNETDVEENAVDIENSPEKESEDLNPLGDNIEIEPLEEIADIDVKESLEEEEPQDGQIIDKDFEDYSKIEVQPEAVKQVVHIIKTSITKHVIAVHGAEGSGKTAILKQSSDCLSEKGYLFLYGSCTPLTQITSFGFFQDAFLRIMGFPPYTRTTEAFIKDFNKSNFAQIFKFLEGEELSLFLNIFYPSQKDKFENIPVNKQIMFSILEKVIKSFTLNSNLVISIDNFELLDGASYDFIIYMLKKGYFNNRLKLLAAYQENKSIESYFDMTGLDEGIFETINIDKLPREEMINAVKRSLYIDICDIMDEDYLDYIIEKSNGNAMRIEQEMALLFNTGYISLKDNDIIINEDNKPSIEPKTFEELIKLRLNSLSPSIKNVLFMAAIMGYRFATSILTLAVTMPVKRAEKIVDYLIQELYIVRVDNYTCEFKSLELWKMIYQEAKADLLYKENSQRLYLTLKPLILSSNLQKLISCTAALSKQDEFIIWQDTASIAAKFGDPNLYIISQKQCLKLIEEQGIADSDLIKSEIYEQIGKLLCEKSPAEAVTYLSNVLDTVIKSVNINKIIDLSGYFVKSCYLSGNYFGAAEAVDAVISAITEQENISACDIALIKTRKLKALFNIGNSEQIINLINEEIIPELETELYSRQIDAKYKGILVDAWLLSKTILAKAYAIQGNSQVFNVIEQLRQFIEKYTYKTDFYVLQINLIEAFAYTISGDLNKSNELLNSLSSECKNQIVEPALLSEWNLINVINRILLNEYEGLKSDLFELAAFTNNINEHFTKNILKLILGYVLKQEGNTKKALEIFNEEITYFAKEKVAIGALLSWLLIVQLTVESGDDEKALNTAMKSLEIAQSPKINNYFFIIYFQKYIAEIYLRKGDFTAAKMYFEKAVMIAKQFNLKYQMIELYAAYGNYMKEFVKSSKNYSQNNINLINEMYEKAYSFAEELDLNNMKDKVSELKSDFKTFCQLNSI